jgi:hypothetical protein
MENVMRSYQKIASQEDMDYLLASIAGFHDSMTKEMRLANRGYVQQDKSMTMTHRFDAQVLIQSQWEPFALEIVFMAIQELHVGDPGEYWGASGSVEVIKHPIEKTRIRMAFDSALIIVCESLSYRVRKEWLGNKSFLRGEVPSSDAIPAHIVHERWRQCSSCREAWEDEPREEFSYCPGCRHLTELDHSVS